MSLLYMYYALTFVISAILTGILILVWRDGVPRDPVDFVLFIALSIVVLFVIFVGYYIPIIGVFRR